MRDKKQYDKYRIVMIQDVKILNVNIDNVNNEYKIIVIWDIIKDCE